MKKFVTQEQTKSTGNISTMLFLIFLILKLTGLINWSWWWVTSPLWIPLCFGVVLFIFAVLATIVIVIKKQNNS
jgi:hypothetical protein